MLHRAHDKRRHRLQRICMWHSDHGSACRRGASVRHAVHAREQESGYFSGFDALAEGRWAGFDACAIGRQAPAPGRVTVSLCSLRWARLSRPLRGNLCDLSLRHQQPEPFTGGAHIPLESVRGSRLSPRARGPSWASEVLRGSGRRRACAASPRDCEQLRPERMTSGGRGGRRLLHY